MKEFSAFDLGEENHKFCLIDANRGIYIPQQFAKIWGASCVTGLSEENKQILLSGPDNNDYWDAWQETVDSAIFMFDGELCELYEDNDLFAVTVK